MLKLVTFRESVPTCGRTVTGTLQAAWPEFMLHDPTAGLYFDKPYLDEYLDTAFAVVDSAEPAVAVGRAFAVPFAFGDLSGRMDLPDTGWDGVIRWANHDRTLGRAANAISALEITLLPDMRGRGASRVILEAMREHVKSLGYRHMFAPVRPTSKHLEPFTPIGEYVNRQTADGLPADPWLRVHVRAGGAIVKVAPVSMVIPGSSPTGPGGHQCPFRPPDRFRSQVLSCQFMCRWSKTMPSTSSRMSGYSTRYCN